MPVRLDSVGVRIAARHDRAEKRVAIFDCLQHGLTKGAREELHSSDLVRNHHVTMLQRAPQRRHTHSLQLVECQPVLGHVNGARVAGGGKEGRRAVQRNDAEPFTCSFGAEVLRVEPSRAHAHRAHNLPNQRRLAYARRTGDEVCRLHVPLPQTRDVSHNGSTNIREAQVQKQGTTSSAARPRPPWSLLAVTIIAVLVPPAGALLTVRNLARVGHLDSRRAAELTAVVFSVYVIGYTILLLVASPNGQQPANISTGGSLAISLGTCLACYTAMRKPYVDWRLANPTARTGTWITAVGSAIVYTLAVSFAVAIVWLLIGLAAYLFHWSFGHV